jgi:hypothetical protein
MLVIRASRSVYLAAAFVGLVSTSSSAQRRASEHGTVSQKVDGTTITLEYDRPVARGRDLFGKLVHWNQTWTPGANNATTIEVDKDVRINGGLLPKGKYSVWMIPRETEPWTVFFHRNARLFHVQRPTQADEQLHVDVRPEPGAHMETLAWYFPVVGPDATTLRMHWGTTIVAMNVDVSSTVTYDSLTAAQRARYVGAYRMSGDWGTADIVISDTDGTLLATRQNPEPGMHATFALVPAGGEHRFYIGAGDRGRVLEVAPSGEVVTFLLEGDRVTAFEVRDSAGKVQWRGDLVKK